MCFCWWKCALVVLRLWFCCVESVFLLSEHFFAVGLVTMLYRFFPISLSCHHRWCETHLSSNLILVLAAESATHDKTARRACVIFASTPKDNGVLWRVFDLCNPCLQRRVNSKPCKTRNVILTKCVSPATCLCPLKGSILPEVDTEFSYQSLLNIDAKLLSRLIFEVWLHFLIQLFCILTLLHLWTIVVRERISIFKCSETSTTCNP